jgi:hypothetical protein
MAGLTSTAGIRRCRCASVLTWPRCLDLFFNTLTCRLAAALAVVAPFESAGTAPPHPITMTLGVPRMACAGHDCGVCSA